MPVVPSGHAGAIRIGGLMAGGAVQARHALASRPAHDVEQMTVPVVTLLWIVCGGVAIDTARISEDRIDLLSGSETRFRRC